ncbi:hypothetical protein [Prescottella equi]|uniref:hypothetical protein n=1 Tax=Rhodococcus hoagii TaxID=43767 RepID=UPI000A0F4484|nr:hypothetical protein [Prescottella equi]ORM02904.1 hypothetical protein A5N72_17110 [Prescottella equi]
MAKPKKSKQRQGVLTEHDLKRFAHLRADPKRLDETLQKLKARTEGGLAVQAELDALAKLEAFRNHAERVRSGQPTKQDRKDMKHLRGRRTTGGKTTGGKEDLEKVFDELGRSRIRAAKARTGRPTSTVGVRRVVSGGAPSLGHRH